MIFIMKIKNRVCQCVSPNNDLCTGQKSVQAVMLSLFCGVCITKLCTGQKSVQAVMLSLFVLSITQTRCSSFWRWVAPINQAVTLALIKFWGVKTPITSLDGAILIEPV